MFIIKNLFCFLLIFCKYLGFGTTIGAHRYFTHKSFKANYPMKVLLLAWQTMAGQQPVIVWARDHR
jgi:stearoyl-CoA desaturase (Delta-9 desaturase)